MLLAIHGPMGRRGQARGRSMFVYRCIRTPAFVLGALFLWSLPRAASAQPSAEAGAAAAQPASPEAPAGPQPSTEAGAAAAQPPATGSRLEPDQRKDPGQYRGRPRETTAADVLIWVPRIVFMPVFAVAEFGVRRPIYTAADWTDRNHVADRIDRILNPTPDLSWAPIVSLDLGDNSSFGAKARWRNALVPGHELKASAEAGPAGSWRVTARDLWAFGSHVYTGVRGDFGELPNRPFFGLGPRSRSFRTNFSLARNEGFVFEGFQLGNHIRVELAQGYRFERSGPGLDPSIDQHFATEELPGYGDLHLALATLDYQLDSRRVREQNSGVRVVGNVTYGQDIRLAERAFLTVSMDFEAAAEVSSPDRVLVARAYAAEAVALGREQVPFTHQPMLGWQNHVGFLWGRFRGESAVLAELQYRYPIAYLIDAQWTLSAGNVFGRQLAGLSVDALTGTIGVGLRTRRAGFGPVEMTFALGTTRFDQPFAFDALRVYFGTTEGL